MSVNVIGVNSTLRHTGGVANKMGAGLIDGRVKVWADTYVIGGSSETSGSTIQFGGYGSTVGYLPTGATILAILLGSSVTQTATLSVGNGYSATAFANGGALAQTASLLYAVACANYVVGTHSYDNYILLTTATATLNAGTLTCLVLYTTD